MVFTSKISKKAPVAKNSFNLDFWPMDNVNLWRQDPFGTFETWIASFRVDGYRSFRESSVSAYRTMFTQWIQFLSSRNTHLLEAVSIDATVFFEQKNLELGTRRRYLQLLSKVYAHLMKIGSVKANPMAVELKKERALEIALPPGLSKQELSRLIHYLHIQSGWKASRDRALLALTAGAGLRNSEAVHCSLDWIYSDYSVSIKSTTIHRDHVSLILPDTALIAELGDHGIQLPWRPWIDEWLELRAELKIPGHILIPTTQKGGAFSPSGLFRRISHWFVNAEIVSKERGVNILRNTFARHAFLSERYSVEQIKEFLGHEIISATMKHLHSVMVE